ncbi:Hypothetical predicted protein [Mytilus galloprovincialis]|uniref:Uncharacterized protein n=1 Tax=Mytilus galloprovincialis TaxID=29158 RepID=A0A8B6GMH9_MYTGA|nr:Hypothetical predicted protein [Mytilus galloprovincialis]
MENLVSSSMTDISKQIYQFLCDEVVGSEKVVKYRRLFFKTYEYTQNNCLSLSKHLITSGSTAERLGLPGSDLDIMLVSKEHIVYEPKLQPEEISAGNNILSLTIDYNNAQPGFVLLKIDNRRTSRNMVDTCTFLDTFVACLGRLTYWVFHRYIPNYFIPHHNIIERQLTHQTWDELLALMVSLRFIKICNQMKLEAALQPSHSGYPDFDKAVIRY